MNSNFERKFVAFEPVYFFQINDIKTPLTEVEYYVWKAKSAGEVIGKDCGGDGRHALDHELYPLMQQYMQKAHELCIEQGLTYWEVFEKVTSWFRKVVKDG